MIRSTATRQACGRCSLLSLPVEHHCGLCTHVPACVPGLSIYTTRERYGCESDEVFTCGALRRTPHTWFIKSTPVVLSSSLRGTFVCGINTRLAGSISLTLQGVPAQLEANLVRSTMQGVLFCDSSEQAINVLHVSVGCDL